MPLHSAPAAPRRIFALALAAGLVSGAAVTSPWIVTAAAFAADAVTSPSPSSSETVAPPQLTLRDANGRSVYSGDADEYPSFGSAISTASDPCPADADDAARLTVTTGTTSVVVSRTVAVASGQPVSVPMDSSFAEVVPDVQASTADLVLECLALQAGVPATVTAVATLPVTFVAGVWAVPGAPVVVPDPEPSAPEPSASTGGSDTPPGDGVSGGSGGTAPAGGTAGSADAGGPLAFTGVEATGSALLAAGLLAGGTFLVVRRRRARRSSREA